MKKKRFTFKVHNILLITVTFLFSCGLLNPGLWQHVECAPAYQINGFYLGATSEDLNVKVDIDPLLEEKYFEVEINGVRLFFVKVQKTLRLYRIVQEQDIDPNKVKSVLDNLKAKYGTPDKQQIKTSGIRPKNSSSYTTTVKNKAIWNISESQEFIAEIESKRVVYELLDHNPEEIKSPEKSEASEASGGGGPGAEGWDPDY